MASDLPGPGFNFAAVLQPDVPSLDELLPVARDFFTGSSKAGACWWRGTPGMQRRRS